jgi:hypothetical protein
MEKFHNVCASANWINMTASASYMARREIHTLYIGRRNLETADMSEDDIGANSKNRIGLPGQSGV